MGFLVSCTPVKISLRSFNINCDEHQIVRRRLERKKFIEQVSYIQTLRKTHPHLLLTLHSPLLPVLGPLRPLPLQPLPRNRLLRLVPLRQAPRIPLRRPLPLEDDVLRRLDLSLRVLLLLARLPRGPGHAEELHVAARRGLLIVGSRLALALGGDGPRAGVDAAPLEGLRCATGVLGAAYAEGAREHGGELLLVEKQGGFDVVGILEKFLLDRCPRSVHVRWQGEGW